MTTKDKYYWMAINEASATVCLMIPLAPDEVYCRPTPQGLFGYKTAREALAAHQFVLNGDINAVRRYIGGKTGKGYPSGWVTKIFPENPEPPTMGATVWTNAKNAPWVAEHNKQAA